MDSTYLLDTHAFLWFLSGDTRMSPTSRAIISDPENRCFISIASIWEMAIKLKIGKLNLSFDLSEIVTHLSRNSIEVLPITFEHILETMKLDDHHRDPFDRLIIAQAQCERITIITKDENFSRYAGLQLIW